MRYAAARVYSSLAAAAFHLAECYMYEQGVAANPAAAKELYTLAAAGGHEEAQQMLPCL